MKAGMTGDFLSAKRTAKLFPQGHGIFLFFHYIDLSISQPFIFFFKIFTGLEKGHHLPLELEREVHMKSTYL